MILAYSDGTKAQVNWVKSMDKEKPDMTEKDWSEALKVTVVGTKNETV